MSPSVSFSDVPTESSSLLTPESDHRKSDQIPKSDDDARLGRSDLWVMPALAIGVFLSAADQTIVVTSYGKIGSDMEALNSTSWLATGYLLTLSSFQILYGKLSDIFGRKPMFLIAYGIFGLGCLFCGLARTMNELVAARALAGVGGGGFDTLTSIVFSDIIPLRQGGVWRGYRNLVYAGGLATGTLLGGFFTDSIGWRYSFYFQVPIAVLGFINVYFAPLKSPAGDSLKWRQKLKRVDFGGAVSVIAGVSSLLLGLDHGSNTAWESPTTVAFLCISVILLTTFFFIELKVAAEPFVPRFVFFDRALLACFFCNFFAYSCWLAIGYDLPLYWQAVEGLSTTQAALRLLPGMGAGVISSLVAGWIMQKTGRYFWLTVIAFAVFTLAVIPIILSTGLVTRSLWGIWVGSVCCGFALNTGATSTIVALMASAGQEHQAVAISCFMLFRSLGSEIGLALSTAVIQSALRNELHSALGSGSDVDRIAKYVRESLDNIALLTPELQRAVRLCYEVAVRWSFVFNLCCAAGALAASLFIRERSLSLGSRA